MKRALLILGMGLSILILPAIIVQPFFSAAIIWSGSAPVSPDVVDPCWSVMSGDGMIAIGVFNLPSRTSFKMSGIWSVGRLSCIYIPENVRWVSRPLYRYRRRGFQWETQTLPDAGPNATMTVLGIPAGLAGICCLIAPAIWIQQRRTRRQRLALRYCLQCGYDLRAALDDEAPLPDFCPRCGAPAPLPISPPESEESG